MGFVKECEEVLIIDGGALTLARGRRGIGVRGGGVCVGGWVLSLKAFLNIRLHKNVANYCVNAKEIRSVTEI